MKYFAQICAVAFIAACFSSCKTTVYETETVVLPYPSKPKTVSKPKPVSKPTRVNPATLEAVGPSDR